MPKNFNLPLVNAHTHAAMIAFRGMADDVPLGDWLEKYIWPAEREKINAKFVYENSKKAIQEMKRNRIRVFSDMYFFEEEVARAAEEEKIHAVVGEAILDFPTPSARSADEALETTEKLLLKYKNNPYVSVAVAPHSIYAVSRENLIKAKKLAKKHNAIYHIHLSETKDEFDQCLKNNKTTPVGYMENLQLLDEKSVLAHCVWLTDEDIEILAKRKAKVIHCPLSNLKLGSGIAPIAKLIERNIVVALGTDSAASSNRLDIWEAGKFASLLQKGVNNDPTKIPNQEALRLMTISGLKSLGIENIDDRSISDLEKEVAESSWADYLYELNINEL